MKRSLRLLVAPLTLVLGAGSAAVIGTGQSASARVYTVAEVQAGLAHKPGAWVGRTLRVRGVYTDCGPPDALAAFCLAPDPADLGTAPAVAPLPLVVARSDLLRALLRRLPVLRYLVAAAPILPWGQTAVFRVQLRVRPHSYGALVFSGGRPGGFGR
jgi:hypothetical protein